jgi:hypothetical protein
MKHVATVVQHHAASADNIVAYMTPATKSKSRAAKPFVAHPHGTVSGMIIARPKGVLRCL